MDNIQVIDKEILTKSQRRNKQRNLKKKLARYNQLLIRSQEDNVASSSELVDIDRADDKNIVSNVESSEITQNSSVTVSDNKSHKTENECDSRPIDNSSIIPLKRIEICNTIVEGQAEHNETTKKSESIEAKEISEMDVKTADKSKTENEIKQQLRVERKRLQQAQKAAKQENKQKNTEEHQQSREKPSEKSNTGENSNINLPKKDECAVEENKSEPKVLSPSDDNVQTRKAELRAERRQKQEMQRAAKMANKTESEASKSACSAPKKVADSSIKPGDDNVRKKIAKKPTNKKLPASEPADKIVKLFSHLVQHENASIMKSTKSSNLHPAILHLGQQYAQGIIVGSNARCVALLLALKQVVNDYVTPPHKELCRDLEAKIKPYTSFLNKCRPLAVSMENAIKHIQFQIGNIPSNTPDSEAKRDLKKAIEKYEYVNIVLARQVITGTATKKIVDGDVILTYACSSLIKAVLLEAKRLQIKFSVVVVDGRPKMEGKELVRFLVRNEIRCTYVTINAVSCIMKEVTKVMLGAHALQANGYVMSRIGCSQIALVAKAYNVPVLVCCGTYKFCEQVQVDSFVYNELGDPNELACPPNVQILNNWKDIRSLSLLNLVYDVTPPHLVTAVITEKGMLPCTSVPAVLRVLQDEIQN